MYDFALFDYMDEKIVERFFPYPKIDSYLSHHSPFYPQASKELLISMEFDRQIYTLTNNGLIPKYTLAFNTDYQLPEGYQKMERVELHDQLAEKNVVTYLDCLDESESFLALTFPPFHESLGLRTHLVLIDRQSQETKHYRLGDRVDPAFPYFTTPRSIQDGYVLCAMDAIRVINVENIASISCLKNKISERDNPVLFFYKLKSE